MAERFERATHNSQTLLSRVRVRFTARADTCLVWDRWRYPVSRATRYTLFKAPDNGKPQCAATPPGLTTREGCYKLGNCPLLSEGTDYKHSLAPVTGDACRIGSIIWVKGNILRKMLTVQCYALRCTCTKLAASPRKRPKGYP